jgi:hypothetical protein
MMSPAGLSTLDNLGFYRLGGLALERQQFAAIHCSSASCAMDSTIKEHNRIGEDSNVPTKADFPAG